MEITVKNLVKGYGELTVFDGFSISFAAGKTTCIMGASGCGKTTLLRVLMGLEPFDGGMVEGLDGKKLSAVFQEGRLCENLSVLSNLRLVCGRRPKDAFADALEAVGLSGLLEKPVRELSGGMKRRVAILRALLSEFDVLFLDEPFKGLDEETRRLVASFVLQKSAGKTVLMVSHDPDDAALLGGDTVTLSSTGH